MSTRLSSSSGTTRPTCPQAVIHVSWRWATFLSERDLRMPRTFVLFRRRISSSMFGGFTPPKNAPKARPAARRSSRRELWRDCTHQCPGFDFSKSQRSVSFEWRRNRLREIIATMRGRLDSRKLGSRIILAKIEHAADFVSSSKHWDEAPSPDWLLQKEHLNLGREFNLDPIFNVLSVAQERRESKSINPHRPLSSSRGKLSLWTVSITHQK